MSGILESILNGIYSVVLNHGWSIVIFTLLIRFVLLPLDYKSRKSMQKTQLVSGQMTALQKKYANDKQKLNQKMAELYKKEGISPLSGCIPMLIQWPVLIAMFAAMRAIANEQMVAQVFRFLLNEDIIMPADRWLWVKNVWASDSLFTSVAPSMMNLEIIGADVWNRVFQTLSEGQIQQLQQICTIDFSSEAAKGTITMLLNALKETESYKEALTAVPGWNNVSVLLFNFTVYKEWNGLLILPVLAGVSQVLMTKLNPASTGQTNTNTGEKGSAQSTAKFMQVFFPILSVWFCLTSNAGFAIYWVTSNIASGLMGIWINYHLEHKNKKLQNGNKAVTGEGSVK